jgi:hypothetical protein
MNRSIIIVTLAALLATPGSAMNHDRQMLLKARYDRVAGTDVEYAQGAIEKNDLAHREIAPSVWLFLVDAPTSAVEWQRKLNAAVDPRHGRFTVEPATAEEERELDTGQITLQK